jgi:hypothetical protein
VESCESSTLGRTNIVEDRALIMRLDQPLECIGLARAAEA